MDKQREDFEAWVREHGNHPRRPELRSSDGAYHYLHTESEWRAWQAAQAAQPAQPFKKLSDDEVLWIAQSHGIDVYACNPLAFYADLISTSRMDHLLDRQRKDRDEALSVLQAQPERAEDSVNAKRYLWLRDEAYSAGGKTPFIVIGRDDSNCYVVSGTTADEAIDAAIKQGGQHD